MTRLKHFLWFFLCTSLLFPVFGQQPESPNKRIGQEADTEELASPDPKQKVRALLKESSKTLRKDPQAANGIALRALALSRSIQDSILQAQSYDLLGRSYHHQSKYLLATQHFELGLDLVAENPKYARLDAHLNNSLAIIMSKRGEYAKALPYFIAAKRYFTSSGSQRQLGSVLTNLAALYIKLDEYNKAIDASQETIRIANELPKYGPAMLSNAFSNLGSAYEGLGLYDMALNCYRKALNYYQSSGTPVRSIGALVSIFSVHAKKKEDIEAQDYFKQAFSLAQATESKYWLQRLYQVYGEYLEENQRVGEAVVNYQESLKLARYLTNRQSEMELNGKLAKAYASIDQHKAAYDFQIRFQNLKDSLFQAELNQLDEEKRIRDLLDEEFDNLQAENVSLIRETERAKLRTYGMLGVGILILVALFALTYHLRVREKDQRNLKAKNQEIETKNTQLQKQSKDMEEQNRILEAMNKNWEQFAVAASHDLRQPLRTIISYLDLLERRHGNKLSQDAHEFLDYASNSASSMEVLLRDLLEFSKVGRSQAQLEQVDLNEVLTNVRLQLSKQIQEADAKLHFDQVPMVNARFSEMVQLFQNLISNAIKFKHPDRTPEVIVQGKIQGNEIVYSVRDNGIGIDSANKDKVFVMFERLNGYKDFEGTGIGLAICQQIMIQHGGRIWVESTPGEGTIFFAAFPNTHASPTATA
ncbi:MAG: ATP-binding protein [Bacteroidota bacterium]